MSPFGVFTIVLISLYAVYYAVLISRDIYGMKNATKHEEEEFDISSLQEEDAAVSVEESDNGFSLTPFHEKGGSKPSPFPESERTATMDVTNGEGADDFPRTDLNIGTKSIIPPAAEISTGSAGTASATIDSKSASQEKIDKIQDEMDEIDPIGNLTMSKEFFRDLLLQANREGSLFVQKKQVPAV